MKNQISLPPATKAKQLKVAQQITRKMYRPVFIMAALVLVSWLPYVLRSRGSDALPSILAAWGGTDKGCNALLNTSPIASAKNKYHLFLVCLISDPTVDPLEDDRIAISKPFDITGGLVQIAIVYEPLSPITSVAKPGTTTTQLFPVLLPKSADISSVKRLSDVDKDGGQIIVSGTKLKN